MSARMEIDAAALRCEVPAFLLNPLVENAVKHGAAGTADAPLVLRVDARLVEPGRLRLSVENSGGWRPGRTAAVCQSEQASQLTLGWAALLAMLLGRRGRKCGSIIFQRRDGRWIAVHEHLSPMPAGG